MALRKINYKGESKILKNLVTTVNELMDESGGGHVIEDNSGTEMTQRANLQFKNVTGVSDDSVNDRTIVTVLPFYITGDTTVGFTPHYPS